MGLRHRHARVLATARSAVAFVVLTGSSRRDPPDPSGRNARGDDDESIATIQRALDLGLTFFDAADMDGPHTNEILLGRALGNRRDEAVIATRIGIARDPDDPKARFQWATRVCAPPL